MSNEVEPRTRVDAYPRLSPVDADSDLFSARRDPDADLICYRKANHYMLCVQISPVYTGPLLAASW